VGQAVLWRPLTAMGLLLALAPLAGAMATEAAGVARRRVREVGVPAVGKQALRPVDVGIHAIGSPFELSDLDGTNGCMLNGAAAGDFAGAVSGAGDVNDDGVADDDVGASGADPNGASSGASYVVFGEPGEPLAVELTDFGARRIGDSVLREWRTLSDRRRARAAGGSGAGPGALRRGRRGTQRPGDEPRLGGLARTAGRRRRARLGVARRARGLPWRDAGAPGRWHLGGAGRAATGRIAGAQIASQRLHTPSAPMCDLRPPRQVRG
jgi:hypothetical protein